jgi:YbbR domain-containing protein
VQARGTAQTLTDQAVAVTDLAPGLAATVEPATVDVQIFAAEDTLVALRAGEIVPQVSAAGLGAGTYELPLEVSVPAGVQWLGTEPATVAVTIGSAPGGGTPVASPGSG